MPEYITDDLEISSDSDREDSDEENYNEENCNVWSISSDFKWFIKYS